MPCDGCEDCNGRGVKFGPAQGVYLACDPFDIISSIQFQFESLALTPFCDLTTGEVVAYGAVIRDEDGGGGTTTLYFDPNLNPLPGQPANSTSCTGDWEYQWNETCFREISDPTIVYVRLVSVIFLNGVQQGTLTLWIDMSGTVSSTPPVNPVEVCPEVPVVYSKPVCIVDDTTGAVLTTYTKVVYSDGTVTWYDENDDIVAEPTPGVGESIGPCDCTGLPVTKVCLSQPDMIDPDNNPPFIHVWTRSIDCFGNVSYFDESGTENVIPDGWSITNCGASVDCTAMCDDQGGGVFVEFLRCSCSDESGNPDNYDVELDLITPYTVVGTVSLAPCGVVSAQALTSWAQQYSGVTPAALPITASDAQSVTITVLAGNVTVTPGTGGAIVIPTGSSFTWRSNAVGMTFVGDASASYILHGEV